MPYRDPSAPVTLVARSRGDTRRLVALVAALGVASVGLALTAALRLTADPFLPGLAALLSGSAAIGLLVGRVRGGAGDAPCPACGARVEGVERVGRVEGLLCDQCKRFLRADDGALGLEDPRAVAETPIFGASVGDRLAWPPGCVVCGEPPTQALPVHLHKTDVGASVVASTPGLVMAAVVGVGFSVTKGKRVDAAVPHCRAHDDGARLAEGGPTGFVLYFRSHAYARQFCEQNGAEPVESPATGRAPRWYPGASAAVAEAPRGGRPERPRSTEVDRPRPVGANRARARAARREAQSKRGDEGSGDDEA